MRKVGALLTSILGCALVVTGLHEIYPPLSLIVGGAALVYLGEVRG